MDDKLKTPKMESNKMLIYSPIKVEKKYVHLKIYVNVLNQRKIKIKNIILKNGENI